MCKTFEMFEKYGIVSVFDLMKIAASAKPSSVEKKNYCGDVWLDADGGWEVEFFYDIYELDYISTFKAPCGWVFDFWEDDCITEIFRLYLINWRDEDDGEELLKMATKDGHVKLLKLKKLECCYE